MKKTWCENKNFGLEHKNEYVSSWAFAWAFPSSKEQWNQVTQASVNTWAKTWKETKLQFLFGWGVHTGTGVGPSYSSTEIRSSYETLHRTEIAARLGLTSGTRD